MGVAQHSTIAARQFCKNIILLGEHMQLSHPIQGTHPDLLPYDISFAYSLNCLNVALSRAQCLAVIVHTDAMRLASTSHLEDVSTISFTAALTPTEQ